MNTLEQINSMADHPGKQILLNARTEWMDCIVVPNNCIPEHMRQHKRSDVGLNTENPESNHVYGRTLSELDDITEQEYNDTLVQDEIEFEKMLKRTRLEVYTEQNDNGEQLSPFMTDEDRLYRCQLNFCKAIGLLDD